ncbi:MAG: DUF202 domain-containing protein [Actinobacteria bacterium]|nr:DUF202 domain-containing protein [Actinomycetota bacterium]MBO0784804.1 DUF202 domain-containing protein [Actinomycetota bacterium]
MTGPADRPHPADPADVTERTYLAWQRTGLAFAAVGALLVRAAGGISHLLAWLPGLAGLVAGGLILLRGLSRYRALRKHGPAQVRASPVLLGAVAAAAALIGLATLAILAAA